MFNREDVFGRRGAILVEMTGGQKNSGRCMWYIILGMTCLLNFISFLLITCVAAKRTGSF